MYGADVMGKSREEVQKQADLWVDWFGNNAPDKTFFWYIIDEPRTVVYPWIKERTEWVKSNPGTGKVTSCFYNQQLCGRTLRLH